MYEGSTYLFFLEKNTDGGYTPICYSYYLFEEITLHGAAYLVPSETAKEFHLTQEDGAEPLFVYTKVDLIRGLKQFNLNNKPWNSKDIKTQLGIDDFYSFRNQRQEPNHCSYLSASGKKFRWQNLSDQPVAVRYARHGDPACAQSVNSARAAINDLNMYYDGVAVVDAGTFDRQGDYCNATTALGANYLTWVNQTFGGSRHITIQFNDPCGEIGDLDPDGGGILALGGLYALGTHTYQNEEWLSGAYGYVVLNNGVGNHYCTGAKYKEIISHELTHSIGLGHISSINGDANMNPYCCHSISGLDESCVDFAYAQEDILPMELLHFSGRTSSYVNELNWTTAWEHNVDHYVLERAPTTDWDNFTPINLVSSKGDTETGNHYFSIDKLPITDAYYRLKSVDFSGEEDYSKIIHIRRLNLTGTLVYPNITQDQLFIQTNNELIKNIEVISLTGQTMMFRQVEAPSGSISVSDLPTGWYILRLSSPGFMESFSFSKMD